MTDKDINRLLMEYVELVLKQRYENDPLTYVSANIHLYYQEKPRRNVAPDVFVVHGVGNHLRTTYVLWEEKQVPAVAFEFTARRSKQVDAFAKKDIYEAMGISEYYVFDPTGEFMTPRFRAFRTSAGRYQEVSTASGVVPSPALGLDLMVDGEYLRLRDSVTGHVYPMPDRVYGLLRSAEENAREQTRRANRLAERLRALGEDV